MAFGMFLAQFSQKDLIFFYFQPANYLWRLRFSFPISVGTVNNTLFWMAIPDCQPVGQSTTIGWTAVKLFTDMIFMVHEEDESNSPL